MVSDDETIYGHDGPGHALERLIFFSDAVFAIAITLLVIELKVPHLELPARDIEFVAALAQMIPNFVGFFVSFFVIGAFWSGHHRSFLLARHWDMRLIMPNLMLLCAVAAMPFFTAFSADYPKERVPVMLYCCWLLLTALCNIRLQRIVTTPPVAGEGVPAYDRGMIRVRGYSVALGSLTALVVAYFYPVFGQPTLMSILVWRYLLQPKAPKAD